MTLKAEKRKWFLPKPFVITAAACLVAASVFFALACTVSAGMYDQKAAQLWQGYDPDAMRYAQVSVFFERGSGLNYDRFGQMRYNIDEKLLTDNISGESDNEIARLWIYAASTDATINAVRGTSNLSVTATAVMGDFFSFHPIDMMSGSYLRADELSKDIVLLDWNTAWRLFGGYEITDMELEIGGIRVIVGGVFEKEEGDTADYRIYMSYELYERINKTAELTTLEFVLPEPISQYASTAVKDNLTVAEQKRVIVENTTRFDLSNLLDALINLDETIAQTKPIALPYWENMARAAELRGAVCLLLAIVLAVLPAIAVLWIIAKIYKKRTAFVPWVKRFFGSLGGRLSRKKKTNIDSESVGDYERILNDGETVDGSIIDNSDDAGDIRVQADGE